MSKEFVESEHPRAKDGEFTSGGSGGSSTSNKPVSSTGLKWARAALTVGLIASIAVPGVQAVAIGAALEGIAAGAGAGAAIVAFAAKASVTTIVGLGILRHVVSKLIETRQAENKRLVSKVDTDPVLTYLKDIQAKLAAYKPSEKK